MNAIATQNCTHGQAWRYREGFIKKLYFNSVNNGAYHVCQRWIIALLMAHKPGK
tara:strand:+ start:343 stop:504 length:162 start_codon:yes stop_codon:yes gene_type:complete